MDNVQDIFNFINEHSKKNGVSVFSNRDLDLDVRVILNEDGSISVNLEDTARGFGFTRIAKSGNEVVRWERLEGYLRDLGVPICGHGDYIPESLFYMLAMKANNERAQKFQKWLAIDVIPSIRKTGYYEMPKPNVNSKNYEKPKAKQRELTKDDYVRAASIISGCRNERMPYVMAFLEQAGFKIPEMEKVTPQARKDIDVVESWINDRCNIKTGLRIDRATAYKNFEEYCEEEERQTLTRNKFFKALRIKNFSEVRGKYERFFVGISLK